MIGKWLIYCFLILHLCTVYKNNGIIKKKKTKPKNNYWGSRTKSDTSAGPDQSQGPLKGTHRQKNFSHQTSAGTGFSQWPPQDQAWDIDICCSRPEPATSEWAATREKAPRKQAWAKDHCRAKSKVTTSAGAGMSQQPQVEEGRASNLHMSSPKSAASVRPESVTTTTAGLTQTNLWD